MKLFHIIDDVQIILRSKGVYRQASLFRRGKELFAKYGSGFVRLTARGGTSAPSIPWVDMEDHPHVDKQGGKINAPRWTGVES